MRIGILNWRDRTHPEAGGAELVVHEVGKQWAEWGHDVWLFASRYKESPSREVVDGIKVVRVGRLRNATHHLQAPGQLRRVSPDVILESINTIPYQLPLRRNMPPSVPFVHQLAVDVWDAHLPRGLAALARRMEPLLYRAYRSKAVLANSSSTAQDLAGVGVGMVSIVPLGGWGAQPLPAKATSPTLVFAGRLAANKRPDHAVAAFRLIKRELPDARLWIIGQGPMQATLARDLPPGAELLGRLELGEFRSRLGEAHLLLATSVREGWGLMVTDANCVGTPAVAYRVPGLRDSVRDNISGRLTAADPHSLAATVVALLRDQDAYSRLRDGAIDFATGLSWERTAKLLLAELENSKAEIRGERS